MGKGDGPRFWEVDLLRGVLVLLMVIYHVVFDLIWFGDLDLSLDAAPMRFARIAIASGFIFLVGVSLSLSRDRDRGRAGFRGYLLRGGLIFGLGLLATMASFVIVPDAPIYFGALHCIGICLVLSYPFLNRRFTNLVLGSVLTAAGILLSHLQFSFSWLLWLGLRPDGLRTVDLFPLLPWFGVVLLGMFAGGLLYRGNKRMFKFPDLLGLPPFRIVGFMGRHTLVLYIVHQPVLLGLFLLMGLIELGQ